MPKDNPKKNRALVVPISMNSDQKAKAERIGGGNRSKGVQMALQAYREQTSDQERTHG